MASGFKALGVNQNLIKGLNELNITEPTPIQESAIPFLIEVGTDFVGQAQTGTGKTAAFGLPLLNKINPNSKDIQAVILTPTRELAQQIAKQLFKFTKYTDKIFTESVYGGEQIEKQINRLSRTTHIVVGTPGRMSELLNRKVINFSQVKTVVLDEADEMLSMGFKSELDKVMVHLPEERNTWLFSATMPLKLNELIAKHLQPSPEKALLSTKAVVNPDIHHQFVKCTADDRDFFILNFLKQMGKQRGLIFCRTRADGIHLNQLLNDKGQITEVLHGDLLQKERDKIMRAFRNENIRTLITTDVFARGLDIEDLAYVVHHKLPKEDEYYIHRSGRTARAGKQGISIAFCTQRDLRRLGEIEEQLKIRFELIK